MEVKFQVVEGDFETLELWLRAPITIGRSRDADVTIPHPLVSRQHCEVELGGDDQLKVRDLGSLNGTYVGPTRIIEAVLGSGQLLSVGPVTFRAIYGEDSTPKKVALDRVADEIPDLCPGIERHPGKDQSGDRETTALDETQLLDETQPFEFVDALPVHEQRVTDGEMMFDEEMVIDKDLEDEPEFNWLEDRIVHGGEASIGPAMDSESEITSSGDDDDHWKFLESLS